MSQSTKPQHPKLIYDREGQETIRSTIFWLALILVAGCAAFNVFLPNSDINIGIGAYIVVFSSMVLLLYGGRAIWAIATGSEERSDYLIVGVCISWFVTEAREILVIIARLADLSPAILNSDLLNFLKLGYPIAAVYHVLPRGAADGTVPRGNKAVVVTAFVIATVLAVALVSIKPETAWLIERMPMWMKDVWRTSAASGNTPS